MLGFRAQALQFRVEKGLRITVHSLRLISTGVRVWGLVGFGLEPWK